MQKLNRFVRFSLSYFLHQAAASTQASVSTSAAEVGKAKAKAKAKTKAKTKTKSKEKAGPALEGSEAPGLCERVPGVGRGVMMGVYVQDLMRLDKGAMIMFAVFHAHDVGSDVPARDGFPFK